MESSHHIKDCPRPGFCFPVMEFHNINSLLGECFTCFSHCLGYRSLFVIYIEILAGSRTTKSLALKIDRELEVFERMFNDFAQGRLAPAAMIVIPIIEITSIFATLKMYSEIPFPGILVFPLAVVVLMAQCPRNGRVKVTSGSVRGAWSGKVGASKATRRSIRAMRPITVRFGSNFMDRETALLTQDFCVNQIVSLLMI